MSAALIMAIVAGVLIFAAILAASRAATDDKARVRQRITATMLGAGGLMLAAFAAAMHGWDAAR